MADLSPSIDLALFIVALVGVVYGLVWLFSGTRKEDITCDCGNSVARGAFLVNQHSERRALQYHLSRNCVVCQARHMAVLDPLLQQVGSAVRTTQQTGRSRLDRTIRGEPIVGSPDSSGRTNHPDHVAEPAHASP